MHLDRNDDLVVYRYIIPDLIFYNKIILCKSGSLGGVKGNFKVTVVDLVSRIFYRNLVIPNLLMSVHKFVCISFYGQLLRTHMVLDLYSRIIIHYRSFE